MRDTQADAGQCSRRGLVDQCSFQAMTKSSSAEELSAA